MKEKNLRQCLACGEIHYGETCPLIQKRLKKYTNSKNQNFLMGNIVLECIHKNVDFFQILLEIAELNEEVCDTSPVFKTIPIMDTVMPIELSVEYFAAALNCKSRNFFMDTKKTIEEYGKLLRRSTFDSVYVQRDQKDNVNCICIPIEINDYSDVNTEYDLGVWCQKNYNFELYKLLIGKNECEYRLCINLPDVIRQTYSNEEKITRYPNGRTYFWGNMEETSPTDILLARASDGVLKDLFEEELSRVWIEEDLIKEVAITDNRFQNWVESLGRATKQGLLEWRVRKSDTKCKYSSIYGKTDIVIVIDNNIHCGDKETLYVRNQEGGLGLRFGHRPGPAQMSLKKGHMERIEEQGELRSNARLVALCRTVDTYIDNKSKDGYLDKLPRQYIEHTEVLVSVQSMICQDHRVKPLLGIVHLLTLDNKVVDYEIYVGYCPECNKYYCFYSDYINMIQKGKPLCAVYEESDKNQDIVNGFRYKSQSVLNAMGYTVGMETNLNSSERQKILEDALRSHIFGVHDLISFLNWLIQTRKNQIKFSKAVEKWTEDLKFVKNYEKEKRGKITVEKIVIKTK